jgi:signal transduction histidine kinase
VEVRDTGIGMTPEEQQQLFQRFFRSDRAREMGVEGTGLGLSITKHLVELHGGEIRVESTPDRGSSFFVTFPIGR